MVSIPPITITISIFDDCNNICSEVFITVRNYTMQARLEFMRLVTRYAYDLFFTITRRPILLFIANIFHCLPPRRPTDSH